MSLPENTRNLWETMAASPHLAGFVLIGGTALALQIDHRISQDLDFFWHKEKLPLDQINSVLKELQNKGVSFQKSEHHAALEDFHTAGMNIDEYQQDYVSNTGVRISFFCGEAYHRSIFAPNSSDRVRLASIQEIFDSKCVLSAKRTCLRDMFDLYFLMTRFSFTIEAFVNAFEKSGMLNQIDISLTRLCLPQLPQKDPGYQALIPDPPSLEVMSNFFKSKRDAIEQVVARKALRSDKRNE